MLEVVLLLLHQVYQLQPRLLLQDELKVKLPIQPEGPGEKMKKFFIRLIQPEIPTQLFCCLKKAQKPKVNFEQC